MCYVRSQTSSKRKLWHDVETWHKHETFITDIFLVNVLFYSLNRSQNTTIVRKILASLKRECIFDEFLTVIFSHISIKHYSVFGPTFIPLILKLWKSALGFYNLQFLIAHLRNIISALYSSSPLKSEMMLLSIFPKTNAQYLRALNPKCASLESLFQAVT